MALQRVDEQQCVSVDIHLRFLAFLIGVVGSLLGFDEWRARGLLGLGNRRFSFVDIESRMQREDRRIGFGVRRETIKLTSRISIFHTDLELYFNKYRLL